MAEPIASLLNLIDHAYLIGEDRADTESMFNHAYDYLDGDLDPEERQKQAEGLARHADRIGRLFGMTGTPSGVIAAVGRATENLPYPALTFDKTARVINANSAMRQICSADPAWLSDLPFERDGIDRITSAVRSGMIADVFLLHSQRYAKPSLALVDADGAQFILRFAEVRWTPERVAHFAKPFDIPPRELDTLHGALIGESQAEIAARLDRSVETIRSQSKSLLLRTGVPRMTDLVLLAHSSTLMRIHSQDTAIIPSPDVHVLTLPDKRQIAYRSFGPDDGKPFVFFHGFQLGPFLTPALIRGLEAEGIRLIAPSRPGFGETSQISKGTDFNATVISDALAVVQAVGFQRMVVVAHQGGTSHAFRTAARLGDRVPGMLMIGAGIPIDPVLHIPKMNAVTRMAALATKRMPTLLELMIRIGVHSYTKDANGPRRYLEFFFRNDPVDLRSLQDANTFDAIQAGALHMIAQGPRPMMLDGTAAMDDWTADFQAVSCHQLWLHGAHCPVMNAQELENYIRARTNHPIEISPHTGFHQFYDEPELMIDGFRRAARWLD